MKNIILFSVAALAFVVSGCSNKAPMVDTMSSSTPTHNEMTHSNDTMMHSDNSVNTISSVINNLSSSYKTVYFNFDKFSIRPDMQQVVSDDAMLIKNAPNKNFSVKLEGNCDEFGTDEYNYALGLKRAKSVKDALASQGVDVSSVTIVSYGKTNPVCTEQTKSCYAKNRRVNFKFLP